MNSVEGASEEAFTLSRAQVAERLGLSPERVRQLATSGELHSTRTALGRLFRVSEIDAYRRTRAERAQRRTTETSTTPPINSTSTQEIPTTEKE